MLYERYKPLCSHLSTSISTQKSRQPHRLNSAGLSANLPASSCKQRRNSRVRVSDFRVVGFELPNFRSQGDPTS